MATGSLVGRSVEADVTHRVAQAEDIDGTEVSRTLETRFENLVGHTAGVVNVHSYGSTGTHLAAAAAAATAAGAELVIAHSITVSTAVGTISCPVRMVGAGRLVTATGGSVTLTGPFVSDLSHRFDTSAGGTITFYAQCPEVYPQWWGAVGDGVHDDTAAIQAAINATPYAGVLQMVNSVPGSISQFKVTTSLIFPRPIHFRGQGYGTVILVATAFDVATDVLIYRPTAGTGSEYVEFSNFYLLPESGTPGRDALLLDLAAAGTSLQKLMVDRVVLRARNGRAIHASNPSADHDAVFASDIRGCSLFGGVYLQGAGDSMTLLGNTITSDPSATADGCKWGVEVDLISTVDPFGADSSCLLIQGNNITAQGGAMLIKKGPRTRFLYNNCELYGPVIGGTFVTNGTNNPHKALIDIDGLDAKHVSQTEIRGNFFGPTTHSLNFIVRVNYADDTVIEDNTVYPTGDGSGGWWNNAPTTTPKTFDATWSGIDVTENAIRTYVGPQVWDPAGIVANRTSDAGSGTRGIPRLLTALANSWANLGYPYTAAKAVIDRNGMCHLFGNIAGGTMTTGTTILTLPAGFLPADTSFCSVGTASGTTPTLGLLLVRSTGVIETFTITANDVLCLNDVTFLVA